MNNDQQDTSTERERFEACPFCGKTHTLKITTAQELSEQDSDYDGEFWQHSDSFAVICDASSPNGPGGCGASGGFFPTEAEAVAAWQRRAALASRDEAAVPALYVSQVQLQGLFDGKLPGMPTPADKSGTYLPVRLTPGGKFTVALYRQPAAQQPQGQSLINEEFTTPTNVGKQAAAAFAELSGSPTETQGQAVSDEQIKEVIDNIDFSKMVTADDIFFLIAREVLDKLA